MRYLGIKTTANIATCCKGKRPSAHGYIWRYIGDSFDKYPYISRGNHPNLRLGYNKYQLNKSTNKAN